MVIAIVVVTTISLTFVGTAGLLQLQINQMKSFWYDKAQVAVYLCNGTVTSRNCPSGKAVTPQQITGIETALRTAPLHSFIKKYYFETQSQAYARFREQFKNTPVVDSVTADLLNEAFWLDLKDPTQSAAINEAVGNLPGVDSVNDQRVLLDRIFAVLNVASASAAGLAALMLLAAAILVSTTIRLSALSRRREIGIMRLVGASNRFIRTPFIVEALIATSIGSLLASCALVAIVQFFVQGYLAHSQPGIALISTPEALVIVPVVIIMGAVLAAASSSVAINQYLKV